jgi:uncharacterized protein (TIGR00255 family)
MPEELRGREVELRSRVGDVMKRGKVECGLHLKRGAASGSELTLDSELVSRLAARVDEIRARVPETAALDPVDVLRWPGVVTEPEIDAEPLYEEAIALLDTALAAMADMRASEGRRIGEMIDTRLDDVLDIAAGVRKRMPDVLDAVRAKQQERIDRLDVAADPARLETELALIAQKLDVDEEIDRLESHVSEVRKAMQSGEPTGRRLDFLMQELNREANTLGSKSADAETTKAAVDLKVLIEQMREQIQNVE